MTQKNSQRMTWVIALAGAVLGWLSLVASSQASACDIRDPETLCRGNVTVFVYLDRVERRPAGAFFNRGTDFPIAGARITFVLPDGSRLQKVTGESGRQSLSNLILFPNDEVIVEVEYPAFYRGARLQACPGSQMRRRLSPADFGPLRSTQVVFCARSSLVAQEAE